MKKFVIGLCVGLVVLGGILVSANLNGSPQDGSHVVHVETEGNPAVDGVVLFEREDGTTIEGLLYADGPSSGGGPGGGGPGGDGDNGHCGG